MLESTLLLAALILTNLLAGIFLAYSVSVIPAFRQLGDGEYIRAMQSINKAILNPLFFVVFMGPVFLLPAVTFLYGGDITGARFLLLASASAIYILGTFGITAAGNVPLNDALANVNAAAPEKALTEARARFEPKWNRLHHIRTALAVLAGILVSLACLTF